MKILYETHINYVFCCDVNDIVNDGAYTFIIHIITIIEK